MKNKKNIYFLIPAVLLVWGLLVYKIVFGLNPSTQDVQAIDPIGKFVPKQMEQIASFTIKADYRDPFLGTLQAKKRIIKPKKKAVVKKSIIPFPKIIYKGIVSPKGKNEKVFLILVNGQQHMFKHKTMFKEVKLLRGSTKEITVQFQNQKQTFLLENIIVR